MRYFRIFVAFIIVMTNQVSASDVSMSVRIGQPGFYGELHLGGYYPVPQLIYPEPVLVWQTPANIYQPPVYVHVPPGHAKNWRKHCRRYNACNRNVYFVRETWYNNTYIPYYQKHIGYRNNRNDNRNRQPQQNYPGSNFDRNVRDQHGPVTNRGKRDENRARGRGERDKSQGRGKGNQDRR